MTSGDVIKTQGSAVFPLVLHHGVVLQDGSNTFVMHNTPDKGGAVIEPLPSFLETRRIVSITPSHLNNLSNTELINRFKTSAGRFDLISYNCEHFVERMLGRKIQSTQLVFWAVVILVITFALLWMVVRKLR